MAHAQNETSRGVSAADTPTLDLNHCRSVSTRLISANGVWQIWAARWVRSSKAVSGSVSRISYPLRTEILVLSLAGAVAITDPPCAVDHFFRRTTLHSRSWLHSSRIHRLPSVSYFFRL